MRPINTAEDLFRWIEEVGAGVVPPDDVAAQATLARDALKRLLASTLPERVAEAVMGEREAMERRMKELSARAIEDFTRPFRDGYVAAISDALTAVRSRPAPAQTMAPPTKDAHLNELLARAKARGPMTEAERAAQRESYVRAEMVMGDEGTCVVSPTPPADDRVQRVVEAARKVSDCVQINVNFFAAVQEMRDALDALTDGAGS